MEIIKPRAAKWLDSYGPMAKYNIAESYVEPVTLRELIAMGEETEEKEFLSRLLDTKLDYGDIDGSQELRCAIAKLYEKKDENNVMIVHGAIAANSVALLSLLSPGDSVVTIHPNYQQLYALPKAFGTHMQQLELKKEDGYLPNLDELRRLTQNGCQMIILSNPNNPTSSVMDCDYLEKIVSIAREANAYLLCDEIYFGYPRNGVKLAHVADLYEKGISTGSFSKVYGLSGLRLGWICTQKNILEELSPYRNYTTICCGQLNDAAAVLAMRNFEKLMDRNTAIVQENIRFLTEWLQRTPHISCSIPPAGTFVLLQYEVPIPSQEFCKGLFDKTGTFIMPGSCFDMEYTLRLGIGGDPACFRAGLECLSNYLDEIIGG